MDYRTIPPSTSASCSGTSTVYTVTVSNNDANCTGTSTQTADITIYTYPPVSFDIAISPGSPYCPGDAITLTPDNVSSPCNTTLNYDWINSAGDGLPMTSGNSITIHPDHTTTYTLYGVVNLTNTQTTPQDFQCAAKASIDITIDPPLINLPIDTIICDGDVITITFSQYLNPDDYNFSWTVDNGTATSGAGFNSFTSSALGHGSHTLNVEVYPNAASACVLNKTMTIYASECCSAPNNFEITAAYNAAGKGIDLQDAINTFYNNDPNKTRATWVVGSNILQIEIETNYDIIINGSWKPEYKVEIFKGRISMSEGALLEIPAHKTFTLQGTKINVCTTKLWSGINVLYAGTINTTDDANTTFPEINDAEYAVTGNHLSTVNLENTTFDKNYVSFYIPPATIFPYNTVFGKNNLNHFTCVGCSAASNPTNLLGAYVGHTIIPGTNSYAGMSFNDVAINVDNATKHEDPTTFENLNNGIIGMNSSLLVQNTTFTTMKNFNSYSLPLNGVPGTGIFAGANFGKYGSLTQIGLGVSSFGHTPDLTFSDCVIGIHAKNVSTDISYNRMDGIQNTGVRCENTGILPVHIFLNQVAAYLCGLNLSYNRLSYNFMVEDNSINTLDGQTAQGQYGILYDGITHPVPSVWYKNHGLLCNTISGNFWYGMLLTGLLDNASVKNNSIDMSSTLMRKGMEVLSGSGSTINSNTIYGYDVGYGTAYDFNSNNNLNISDNISNGTTIGFDFLGTNTNTKFITNTIGDANFSNPMHDVGVHLNYNGIIGTQFDASSTQITVYNNQWSLETTATGHHQSYTSGWGAKNDNVNGPQDIDQSRFIVHSATQGSTIYPWDNATNNVQWFYVNTGTETISPNYTDNCIVFKASNGITLTRLDELIAKDSIACVRFNDETKFTAGSDLFDNLNANPELKNSDSIYNIFYNNNENAVLGRLGKVRAGIQHIFEDDTNKVNEIVKYDSLIRVLHIRKSIIDSIYIYAESYNDTLQLETEAASILTEISSNINKINSLIEEINSERQERIDSAIALNNSITPATRIETNEFQFNEIYLHKIVVNNYNFDSTQLATMHYIAPQCPFAGGRAVFQIRGILRQLGDTTIYNDDAACDEENFSRKAKPTIGYKGLYSLVMPNPAKDQCKIIYSLPEDKLGILLINDLKGQEISKYNIPPNSSEIKIDLSHYNCGTYIYSISVEGEKPMHGKLTVIR